ncbi:MAG: DUF1189 domain-containing protein [Candidatus Pacebacteria bacterium]|jgi:maltodextrin utilization protein YvdJ|nr:DUF1189 domain-containing protein [Candidatus Paceibacterota bacterium]
MKTIFETFKKSIYNPAFYQEAANAPLGEIVKYYVKAISVLTVFLVVVISIFLIPQGISFVKERAPYLVKAYYPQELSVHVEDGIASANVPMPYIVSLKSLSKATTTGAIENMLVINTSEDFDKNKFEEYKTFALLTKNDLVTRDNGGAITIQSLKPMPTTTIDQSVLLGWVATTQDYLWKIATFVFVASLLLVFSGYIMYLIPLLIFALIPKFVAYIKRTELSYASAYKMSLYAIVPALALKTLLNVMGIFFLPSYFTLLVFMLIISINMRNVEQPTLFENK